ncbi:MAG: hypothetical protein JWR90_1580, partial [Marmoricola sp.]|nr:hypothetical protein [Marmoricola sp.]
TGPGHSAVTVTPVSFSSAERLRV